MKVLSVIRTGCDCFACKGEFDLRSSMTKLDNITDETLLSLPLWGLSENDLIYNMAQRCPLHCYV